MANPELTEWERRLRFMKPQLTGNVATDTDALYAYITKLRVDMEVTRDLAKTYYMQANSYSQYLDTVEDENWWSYNNRKVVWTHRHLVDMASIAARQNEMCGTLIQETREEIERMRRS